MPKAAVSPTSAVQEYNVVHAPPRLAAAKEQTSANRSGLGVAARYFLYKLYDATNRQPGAWQAGGDDVGDNLLELVAFHASVRADGADTAPRRGIAAAGVHEHCANFVASARRSARWHHVSVGARDAKPKGGTRLTPAGRIDPIIEG